MRRAFWGFVFLVPLFSGCFEGGTVGLQDGDRYVPPATLPALDAAATLRDLKAFATAFPDRGRNSPTHVAARDSIAATLSAANLTVYRQNFTDGDPPLAQQNVCGLQFGFRQDIWVVVGAHYDTVVADPVRRVDRNGSSPLPGYLRDHSQGAYDDGSGTELVLTLAKSHAGIRPYFSVAYCLFDGEERGTQGSKAFYHALRDGKFPYPFKEYRGMLDLDMFGINWPVRTSIWMDTNNVFLRAIAETKRKDLGIPDEYWKAKSITSGGSDFRWWKTNHVPFVFFISDFEEWALPVPGGPPEAAPMVYAAPYPFWHQADTYENMERMAGGAELLRAGFQTALLLSQRVFAILAYHSGPLDQSATTSNPPSYCLAEACPSTGLDAPAGPTATG